MRFIKYIVFILFSNSAQGQINKFNVSADFGSVFRFYMKQVDSRTKSQSILYGFSTDFEFNGNSKVGVRFEYNQMSVENTLKSLPFKTYNQSVLFGFNTLYYMHNIKKYKSNNFKYSIGINYVNIIDITYEIDPSDRDYNGSFYSEGLSRMELGIYWRKAIDKQNRYGLFCNATAQVPFYMKESFVQYNFITPFGSDYEYINTNQLKIMPCIRIGLELSLIVPK